MLYRESMSKGLKIKDSHNVVVLKVILVLIQ